MLPCKLTLFPLAEQVMRSWRSWPKSASLPGNMRPRQSTYHPWLNNSCIKLTHMLLSLNILQKVFSNKCFFTSYVTPRNLELIANSWMRPESENLNIMIRLLTFRTAHELQPIMRLDQLPTFISDMLSCVSLIYQDQNLKLRYVIRASLTIHNWEISIRTYPQGQSPPGRYYTPVLPQAT